MYIYNIDRKVRDISIQDSSYHIHCLLSFQPFRNFILNLHGLEVNDMWLCIISEKFTSYQYKMEFATKLVKLQVMM